MKKKNTYIHKYSQEKYAKRPVAMYVVFVCCSLQLFIISKGLILSCYDKDIFLDVAVHKDGFLQHFQELIEVSLDSSFVCFN